MDWNLYLLIQKPAYQALLFFLLTPTVIFILRPTNVDKAWFIAICMFVLFLIVNSVMLWFDESPWRYFFYSIAFAVGYVAAIAIIMPALIKVLRLDGSGETAMAFLVLIYQPFALMIVMLVKWLIR